MGLPPLLYSRPAPAEFALAVVVPLVYGAVTGLMLGVSEIAYLVLSLLGIAGGFVAGLEHDSKLEGFYRGLFGGLLFGTAILLAHGIAGAEPEAELPDPEILLTAITGIAGAGLGTLGARSRQRRARRG